MLRYVLYACSAQSKVARVHPSEIREEATGVRGELPSRPPSRPLDDPQLQATARPPSPAHSGLRAMRVHQRLRRLLGPMSLIFSSQVNLIPTRTSTRKMLVL